MHTSSSKSVRLVLGFDTNLHVFNDTCRQIRQQKLSNLSDGRDEFVVSPHILVWTYVRRLETS